MRSPFPGVDPYLEASWEDVHGTLITYVRDALIPQSPAGLFARREQRVYVDSGTQSARIRKPAVRVVELPKRPAPARPAGGGVLVAARPVLLDFATDPVVEGYNQLMDAKGGRIVTAVEVVSPANKVEGAGRRAYLRKREEFVRSDANLVEIDLVRAGDWVTMLDEYLVPEPFHTTYRVSIRRSTPDAKGELYPIDLRDRLPVIPVPLRPGEADALIDLQPLVDRVYLNGGYADDTDYTRPCDPPLTGADADWADQLLRAAGQRA
jgi:hypothetical protein